MITLIKKSQVNTAIEAANKEEMRSIKGLGDRLYSLEQLLNQAKKHVQSQSELAQGFQQNKTRCTNLNDESVLPDLCTSHQSQLRLMLNNHNQLRDIRKRCGKVSSIIVTTQKNPIYIIMRLNYSFDIKIFLYLFFFFFLG